MRVSVQRFAQELAAEHFGLDTKVARTLLTLIRHPGRLTTEFLAGRRIRYLPPLRLYVSLSVLFFLAGAAERRIAGPATGGERFIRVGAVAPAGRAGTAGSATPLSASDRRGIERSTRALSDTAGNGAVMRFIKRRLIAKAGQIEANPQRLSARMSDEFTHDLQDALFLVIPAIAALLYLLYRRTGRYYAEHLTFALHFQAFAFAALLLTLLPGSLWTPIALLWITAYLWIALRTAYGESRPRTAAKYVILVGGYVASLVTMMALLGLIVVLLT